MPARAPAPTVLTKSLLVTPLLRTQAFADDKF
jgi:hypothetical protein